MNASYKVIAKNIYLIGPMGSGKSTLGKAMASEFSLNFQDTDEMIIKHLDCSIVQLFERYGENHFRNIERQILFQTSATKNSIIATGGGTPCNSKNLEFMEENGVVVFISTNLDTITNRLLNDSSSRPLIKGISPDALKAFMDKQIKARMPYYSQAEYVVKNDDDLRSVIKAIIN